MRFCFRFIFQGARKHTHQASHTHFGYDDDDDDDEDDDGGDIGDVIWV